MKNSFFAFFFLSLISVACNNSIKLKEIPSRHSEAITGSEFIGKIKDLSSEQRELEIYKEISKGNIPESHHNWVKIYFSSIDANQKSHNVELEVLPDFLAIGSDNDFCRIPMTPGTAQQIADLFDCILPTSKISDIIYENGTVKLTPYPMEPNELMVTVPVFREHNKIIEEERLQIGESLSMLIAGHKKDIIISTHLSSKPHSVIIYGWHTMTGKPIQPVYSGHAGYYVDYSHGVRLVKDKVQIDGKEMSLHKVLKDATLFKLFMDEDEPMDITRYPLD